MIGPSILIFILIFLVWYFSLWAKVKGFARQCIDNIKEWLIKMVIDIVLSSTFGESTHKSVDVEVHRKFIKIPYTYLGANYVIRVPYSRHKRRQMIDYKVFLQKKDGSETEITHQPGCVYLVNADMLGGIGMRVHHLETGEDIYLDKDTIPTLED
jgi:hypothetical protein